jgi:serine/threonine protein kinase
VGFLCSTTSTPNLPRTGNLWIRKDKEKSKLKLTGHRIPILHRDIKPDNVFIKSRSTLGTKNYFYVILSDFGLACEDRPDGDPRVDKYQRAGSQLGTPTWIAPELCYYPYPATPQEEMYFPPGHKHSKRSDLWAVGASIYNLCEFNNNTAGLSHIDMSRRYRYPGISTNTYVVGTVSRKRDLLIPSHYSQELREVVWEASCWDVNHRHSPVSWCRYAHPLLVSSGFSEHGENCKDLPEWATRIHEYMSTAEKLKSRGR